jgi:hypothetical protein
MKDIFSMAQTGGSHIGPDKGGTVDDGEPPNTTFVGIPMKVTFQSASTYVCVHARACWAVVQDYNMNLLP